MYMDRDDIKKMYRQMYKDIINNEGKGSYQTRHQSLLNTFYMCLSPKIYNP